ncbi:Transcriptional regulatory protein WalR [Roseovarius sp. EC-HK134]|jgi:DNA-binding response OmpR family regulator|uniref:Transcriptional regulatory protein WalR n=1 Tax=Roseovarius mucosus TaxID=215743 RepID=A0A1V0RQR1_9RHOB|nr:MULTISPECIES: response regulator [Roseovarius]ARE84118.1 transcriptional regulatory protein WalR [Roseovarius mucosus]AWZ19237.1 Response regulator receiver protein in cluster with DNA polymerase III epsilon subunit [Roseovarius sp. AK1035]EDM33414.1 Response regulator receiver protein [Roseovarius sp. TM1035]VVT03105.1 Transcriptional regulatory protein WalR [Roseovarius sp. EC-HK134]VVT03535.1 Transcriptional regulatory protein WalR [Roseovarius sp. EC-SD190]|tara:strand:+ start:167 stop:550 length:384 start_codon:yes stop_codon:yes gene_type:complete
MPEKTVLLVEDEDNIALALEHLIGRAGYRLRRVATGNAALEAMAEDRPDLVVLDVMLPERSGYEICQMIRADAALKGIKVLMMTAGGGEVERRKGLAVGADAFMTKPFATADLTAQIGELLAGADHD